MLGRLMVFGGCCVLFGAVTAVKYADRALNYVEVQARVDKVSSECSLQRKIGHRREWTRDMDCDLAKALLDDDPEMKGMHITRTSEVTLRYTSPADGQIHTAKYSFFAVGDEKKGPEAGGVITILANTSNPDKIQRL